MSIFAVAALVAALCAGCNKKSESDGESGGEPASGEKLAEGVEPGSFEVKAERVVVTASLAPNKTYEEQGLGIKAADGQTFVCAFYSITNTGSEPDSGTAPSLVGADGTEYQEDIKAAGKLPSEWESTLSLSKIEPQATQSGPRCYQVPTAAAEGTMKLHFKDDGAMNHAGAWETSVDLPAAEAVARSDEAEGEGEEADKGE